MAGKSRRAQVTFGLNWDPDAFLVGEITSKVRDLQNGVHLVAEHEGAELWANIVDGRALDFRAFSEDGSELEVIQLIPPDKRQGRPTENELRPGRAIIPLEDDPDGGIDGGIDGGTDGGGGGINCAYICTAGGRPDGGSICWLQCW